MQPVEDGNGSEVIDLESFREHVHNFQPLPNFIKILVGRFQALLGELGHTSGAAISFDELLDVVDEGVSLHSLGDCAREQLHDVLVEVPKRLD